MHASPREYQGGGCLNMIQSKTLTKQNVEERTYYDMVETSVKKTKVTGTNNRVEHKQSHISIIDASICKETLFQPATVRGKIEDLQCYVSGQNGVTCKECEHLAQRNDEEKKIPPRASFGKLLTKNGYWPVISYQNWQNVLATFPCQNGLRHSLAVNLIQYTFIYVISVLPLS